MGAPPPHSNQRIHSWRSQLPFPGGLHPGQEEKIQYFIIFMISKPPRLPRRRCSGGLWRLPRKGFSSEPPPSKQSAVRGERSKRIELWCLWNQPFRNHTSQSLFVCLKKIALEPFSGAPANSGDSGDFGASGDARAGFCREFLRILEDILDSP